MRLATGQRTDKMVALIFLAVIAAITFDVPSTLAPGIGAALSRMESEKH